MNVAKTKIIVVVLAALSIGLFSLIISVGQQDDSAKIQQAELTVIDNNDRIALRRWAKATCRGWTPNDLAAELDVMPTIKAVVTALGKDLPKRSRQIIEDACGNELIDSEDTIRSNSEHSR